MKWNCEAENSNALPAGLNVMLLSTFWGKLAARILAGLYNRKVQPRRIGVVG